MMQHTLTWRAHEHLYTEKSPDWFWAVGIVTAAIALIAILLEDVLFAVVICIGAIVLVLQSLKKPKYEHYELSNRGIRIGNDLHPYSSLESFWVEMNDYEDKLILKSTKTFAPLLVINIEDLDPSDVRDYLLDYLPEEEHQEPLSHKLVEWLGF